MAAAEPSVEIPDYSDIISDVVNRENIKNFTYVVTPPSAKGENFLSLIYRIKVNGVKDDNEKTELNLILKQPLNSKIFREKFPLHTLYSREAYIYNVILPELCALQDKYDVPEEYKFKHVKCYRADSEEFQEILVFEDMGDKNFTMVNRRVSLGYKHLKLILKNMASFHALSYVLKKLNPGKFEEFTKHTGGIMDHPKDQIQYFDIALERTINAMEDLSFIEKLKAFGVNSYEKLEYYLNPCTVAPGAVLCHGDSWNNNLLFRMEEGEPVDMVLLDWQLARYCSPVTDIAYLFFSSTDYDVRHEHFDDLMDFYHESLTKSLSLMQCNIEDHFPKAVFKRHLKEILPYGLLISFMLLPIVLGEEEDVPDFDELLKKEDHDLDDWKITNEDASSRFESRIRGNVKSFIEMDLI